MRKHTVCAFAQTSTIGKGGAGAQKKMLNTAKMGVRKNFWKKMENGGQKLSSNGILRGFLDTVCEVVHKKWVRLLVQQHILGGGGWLAGLHQN